MRVALVSAPYSAVLLPPNSRERRIVPPLGLLYLQASCHDLAEVQVFDGELFPSLSALVEAVTDFAPDLTGISTYAATYPLSIKVARALRGRCTLVAGGPYATARHEQTLEHFDLVVRGEGEQTLAELIRETPLEQVAGISFLDEARLVRNPDRLPEADLDRIPAPRWGSVDLSRYRRHTVDGRQRNTALMVTSRGCGWGCGYCCDELMTGGRVRLRSSENIIAEVEALERHHDVGFIEFGDDIFVRGLGRKTALLDHLRERRIAFSVNARPDMIDEGVVRTLAHAGCTSLFLGVEAAAPETLAGLGRKSRPGDAAAAARLARKYGMRLVASFMIGAPGESRESILRTIDLARRINPDKALFNIVQPHPGTRLYQDALAQGIIDEYEVDYGRFPGPPHGVPTVCGGLARGELQALSRRAHRAFYGGPRFIMSQLARCRRPRDLARLAALVKRSVVRPTSGSGPLSTPR